MNELDSNKGKQCTLEDDFLVANCLVANTCGGGDENRADSKVLKKLKSMSLLNTIFARGQVLPARGQVRHWPPLLVGECEEVRRLSIRASASVRPVSRGEPLQVGFSPWSTPCACRGLFWSSLRRTTFWSFS